MRTVHKSALLWYSPQEMYLLVTEVDHYPKFLPWCQSARVVSTDESSTLVEISMEFGGLNHTFTTRNKHVVDREVTMKLVDGPFSHLDGQWQFIALGDGAQRACRVEFFISYGFNHASLDQLVGPAFENIAANMVDAFVKRATHVYGD